MILLKFVCPQHCTFLKELRITFHCLSTTTFPRQRCVTKFVVAIGIEDIGIDDKLMVLTIDEVFL